MIPYNFVIRLLTVLSYFLPCIFFLSTCTSEVSLAEAYNRSDAIKNEQTRQAYRLSCIDTLLNGITCQNKEEMTLEVREKLNRFFSTSDHLDNQNLDLQDRLLMPTSYSLSGIGTIMFHKNWLGKITISGSLLLSLLPLLFYRFLKKRNMLVWTLRLNLFLITGFLVNNFLTNVTSLIGTWTILFFLLVQILVEPSNSESKDHNLTI